MSSNTALTHLNASNNQLTSLDVSSNTALTHLHADGNQLTSLDVLNNIALTQLDVYGNQLTSLDVSNKTALKRLWAYDNQLTSLDVSNNTLLWYLWIDNNKLTNLDVSSNTVLAVLRARENQFTFTSLDLSSCNLMWLELNNCPELTTLNLIGQGLEEGLVMGNNPKLKMVCANLDKVNYIDSQLTNNGNGAYVVSTDCENETLNKITGKVSYASNSGLCGTSNFRPFNQLKLKVLTSSQDVKKTITPDVSGNYRTLVPKGNYYLKGALFNSTYFDYKPKPNNNDPSEGLIEFKGGGETKTKDICVTPKGVFDDLAISISGGRIRPAFNVTYTLTYKNIGTTTLSGVVNFKIKDPTKQEFVSATTIPNNETSANITWNFNNLAPFETKTIRITLLINKPTDSPAVHGGDVLKYTARITDTNSVEKEETLEDNTAILNKEVRNSYDPNDKTCIEDRILRPKNVGKYLTYKIRFENKGSAEATNVRVEDVIDSTKFDIKSLRYISSGDHLCVTEVEGNTVNFNFKDINLGFNPSDNKGYVLFKIKTLESLKEGDEIKNKASIYFDFNKPVITETETVVVKKKVIKKLEFSDYFTLTPNPTKGPADLIEKIKGLKIRFFTINDSYGDMLAYDPARTRHFDFWYLTTGRVYYLRVFTENNGILSTRFIKE